MNLDIPVTDIMTTDVVSVTPSQKLVDVKHIFEKKNFHHHIPVTMNGELKGMISLVDYLYAIKDASMDDEDEAYQRLLVKDIMRGVPVKRETDSTVREVTEELAKGEVHAIVITENNFLKGIVSTADVMRFFLRQT